MKTNPYHVLPLMTASLLAGTLLGQGPGGGWDTFFQVDGTETFGTLGRAACSAGDINGDGVLDILVGYPGKNAGGLTNAGTAWVLSGVDGALLLELDGTASSDFLGYSVAGLGDLNGDGVPEMLVGAPFADAGGLTANGYARVFSGADGSLVYAINGQANDDRLGDAVAAIGDLNSDGIADFLIGAPQADFLSFVDAGVVYVYSGADGSRIRTLSGSGAEDLFGAAISSIGDVNNDGTPDMLIGAPWATAGGQWRAGYTDLISGADGAIIRTFPGSVFYGEFGESVAGVEDVNADGVADVLIGASQEDHLGVSLAGKAYVYSGASGALLREYGGQFSGDGLGSTIANAGDVDGDGVGDLLIGSPRSDTADMADVGTAQLYSGATGALLHRVDGSQPGQNLGDALASARDVNGDGLCEFIIGVPGAIHDGFTDAGHVVLYGFNPFMLSSASEISTSKSSLIMLAMDFPDDAGWKPYQLLVSASGTGPVSLHGVQIPLTPDHIMLRTFFGDYQMFDYSSGETGWLDPNGMAAAYIGFDPGLYALIGLTFHAAAVSFSDSGVLHYSSAAVQFTITP